VGLECLGALEFSPLASKRCPILIVPQFQILKIKLRRCNGSEAAHRPPAGANATKFIVWFEPERVTSGSYIYEHFPAHTVGMDIDVVSEARDLPRAGRHTLSCRNCTAVSGAVADWLGPV
jgi:hypothetical protein